jgi:hypothetical protein
MVTDLLCEVRTRYRAAGIVVQTLIWSLLLAMLVTGCSPSETGRHEEKLVGQLPVRSNDPDYTRVRLGDTILSLSVQCRAEITETNITIRTYCPGPPPKAERVENRTLNELIYIILKPGIEGRHRLSVLDTIESLLESGDIVEPVFDDALGVYLYRSPNGLPMFYQATPNSAPDLSEFVISCGANANLSVDDQQCRGLIRTGSNLDLQYRFNSAQIPRWRELNRDIQEFVSRMIEEA